MRNDVELRPLEEITAELLESKARLEMIDDIGRSLMLSAMMGIPYQEAREWKPGDMPSWVQKRWLERQPTTKMELEQAWKWRRETFDWIEEKLAELKAKIGTLGRIERIADENDLTDMIFSLEEFKRRLERATGKRRLIEEYRAR